MTTKRGGGWAASRRVGASAEQRVRWLAAFLYDETRRPRTQREAQWYARGVGPGVRSAVVSDDRGDLPTPEQIDQARYAGLRIVNALRQGDPAELQVDEWRATLLYVGGRVVGVPDVASLAFLDAFCVQTYHALSGLAVERRWLRFCIRERCGQAFVADHAATRYHSERCSEADRAERYRQRRPYDPKARHAAYVRAVRRAHRNPRLKVSERPRRAKGE